MASFNPQQVAWIADKGTYKVEIGASSLNVKQSSTFTLANNVVVEKVNDVLNQDVDFAEIKR